MVKFSPYTLSKTHFPIATYHACILVSVLVTLLLWYKRNNDSLLLVCGSSASSPPAAVVLIATRTRPICGVSLRLVGSPGTCSDHRKTKVEEHNNYRSKLFISESKINNYTFNL